LANSGNSDRFNITGGDLIETDSPVDDKVLPWHYKDEKVAVAITGKAFRFL
jgi:hypothetical protein